jgi:hypothetical protein
MARCSLWISGLVLLGVDDLSSVLDILLTDVTSVELLTLVPSVQPPLPLTDQSRMLYYLVFYALVWVLYGLHGLPDSSYVNDGADVGVALLGLTSLGGMILDLGNAQGWQELVSAACRQTIVHLVGYWVYREVVRRHRDDD